jgi:MATE family multidrug resistance protein
MSTAAVTVMEFTDRVFLSNYSLNAIAAVTPAGIVAFLFILFFSGIVGYGTVFIAQYTGGGARHRIGSVLWQIIYLSIASGIVLAALSLSAGFIFRLGGHPIEVQRLERIYFGILCLGGGLNVAGVGLASFYTGRGLTRPVMLINAAGMFVNIPLDYGLIYGWGPLPELGIQGAALATIAAWGLILILYVALIFTPANDREYRICKSFGFDIKLVARILKYGIPGSLQFCLDVFAFLFFIFMVGRIGKIELAATNIVIAINALAFMPAMGVSQGVSAMVGQALGRRQPAHARRIVWSAIHLLLAYILVLDCVYLLAPDHLIALFNPNGHTDGAHAAIAGTGRNLLRIVALYVFMDAMYMVLAGALRGAGDTRFIMCAIGAASFFIMVLPVYIGITHLNMGVYFAWICPTLFIAALFIISLLRYLQGKWLGMLVVEKQSIGA